MSSNQYIPKSKEVILELLQESFNSILGLNVLDIFLNTWTSRELEILNKVVDQNLIVKDQDDEYNNQNFIILYFEALKYKHALNLLK